MFKQTIRMSLIVMGVVWLVACGVRTNRIVPSPGPATLAAGDHNGRITVGHRERTFILHLPPSAQPAQPLPLVILLHGGGGTGQGMITLTAGGMNTLADQEHFVVVYPDGIDRQWNDGRQLEDVTAMRENIDDVGFVAALIDELARTANIDRGQVYVAGISNGGMMAQRLACDLTDQVAAIGVLASTMPEKLLPLCQPSRPISVVIMAGTADPLVQYQGGEIGLGRVKRGKGLSIAETVKFWTTHDACPELPAVVPEPDKAIQDGTQVRRETYRPCQDGSQVVLYVIEGGGHTWPNGWQYLPKRVIGPTSRELDANQVLWNFFKSIRLR